MDWKRVIAGVAALVAVACGGGGGDSGRMVSAVSGACGATACAGGCSCAFSLTYTNSQPAA